MASGILSVTSIPGWPVPSSGVREGLDTALQAAGFSPAFISPDGLNVGDVTAAQNFLSAYVGSASELSFNKTKKQTALDALFDANFDLAKFIRGGTSTTITATNVGTFLATITNNYRSLRAQIAAASTLAILNAINLNSGWPSNP